jgi:hypothetical protein
MSKYYFPRLFSTDSAKAAKASGYGYLNAIHYMAPYDFGGAGNVCPHATAHCIRACLGWFSGRAAMTSDLERGTNYVRESRKLKAQLFMRERVDYLNRLARDILAMERKARREGLALCVRLNGSSDIAWERLRFAPDAKTLKALAARKGVASVPATADPISLPDMFHWIQFVDYTKNPGRMGRTPANMHLTLSYSGENEAACVAALRGGSNVAVVFGDGLPAEWHGFSVIDGDLHDLRHLDPRGGVVVGLAPKGNKAKKDDSPFIVHGYHMQEAA